jgi:GT2 family glycosyltransferase
VYDEPPHAPGVLVVNRADALPLVSVVIPTRNRADLLEAALLSVMAQEGIGTEFDIEILVIDDGSTDRTPDLVRGYPDVHYYRGAESRGTSAARNRGVTEARGQYVAFLDDDDTWLPWKLRRQIAVLERDEQIGLVYGQEIKRGDESVTVWPDLRDGRTGWMQRSLLTSCPVNTSSTVVRRVAFDHAGLFDESLPSWEDYDMWLRIACHWRFAFVPGPAVIYRVAYSGRFLRCVAAGESEHALRAVTDAALARLEARESVSPEFRQRVEAAVVTRIAGQLSMLGLADAQRHFLLESVRRAPWLILVRDLRWMLSVSAASAAGSNTREDLDRVAEFCGGIKRAAAGDPRLWLGARRIEAEVWKRMAVTLAAQADRPGADARRAAVHALSQHPGAAGRSLLRILVGLGLS